MRYFKTAIVKSPCHNLKFGITQAKLGYPLYETACAQHLVYTKTLEKCGLTVQVIPSNHHFPDSVFIEDVAICTPECAIITRPGVFSRRGETAGMQEILSKFYSRVEKIAEPGTLEGGDVLCVGQHYFIGLSDRTNAHGAKQLIQILNEYGMTGSTIALDEVLHLKTCVSALPGNRLIVAKELLNRPEFSQFDLIPVEPDESYAANSIWINSHVLIPASFPKLKSTLQSIGFRTIEINISEFQKLDGGLSCLSLRF